jgi:excisionase family DNA binding protein
MSPFMRRIVIPSTLVHLDSSTTVKEAARQLSISVRSLDYLIVNKAFQTRRIGKKVLIPHAELVRYARADHYGPIQDSK